MVSVAEESIIAETLSLPEKWQPAWPPNQIELKRTLLLQNENQKSITKGFQTELTPQFESTDLFSFLFSKTSVFVFSCRCTCGVLKDGAIWLLARGDLNAQVAPRKHRCVAKLWMSSSSTHGASPVSSLLLKIRWDENEIKSPLAANWALPPICIPSWDNPWKNGGQMEKRRGWQRRAVKVPLGL